MCLDKKKKLWKFKIIWSEGRAADGGENLLIRNFF